MANGGLAEVRVIRVDEHRVTVKIGNHRVLDIVDGIAEHKSRNAGDTVFANPRDLIEKLNMLLMETA